MTFLMQFIPSKNIAAQATNPSITDPFDPKEVASAVADPWDFFDLHWDASQWQILGIGTRPGKRLHNYGKIHHFQWENPL